MELDLDIAPSTTPLRRLGAVLKWAVVATLLALIVRVIVTNWGDLSGSEISCDWNYLLLAVVLFCVHCLLYAILWHELTAANETAITRGEAIRAWFYSLLGKYIPGKVLLWAGRVLPYRRAGQSVKRVTLCFTLEMALQILAAALIVAVVIAISPSGPLQGYRYCAWAMAAMLLVVVNPKTLQFLLNLVNRLLRRDAIVISMRMRDAAALLGGYVVNGLLLGLAFAVFVRGFHPITSDQLMFLTAAILAAGSLGMMSVFAPGGLGVRDGILLLMLTPIMPDATAAVVVLAARLWMTAAELMCVAIVYLQERMARQVRGAPVNR